MSQKKIMFNRLNPYGNFILDDIAYVNGDMVSVDEKLADAIVKSGRAIDVNANPEFTKKEYDRLKKENELRRKILQNIDKRRR